MSFNYRNGVSMQLGPFIYHALWSFRFCSSVGLLSGLVMWIRGYD